MKNRIRRITNIHKTSKATAILLSILIILVIFIACTSADDNSKQQQPIDTVSSEQTDSTQNTLPNQKNETMSEYTRIAKDFSGYLPTMSSIRGLPIEFALDTIDTVALSCDHGSFISYKDNFKSSVERITLDGADIANSINEPILFWIPFNSAGTIENIQSAVVDIDATDIAGSHYHQTMQVLLDGTYAIYDMPNEG